MWGAISLIILLNIYYYDMKISKRLALTSVVTLMLMAGVVVKNNVLLKFFIANCSKAVVTV